MIARMLKFYCGRRTCEHTWKGVPLVETENKCPECGSIATVAWTKADDGGWAFLVRGRWLELEDYDNSDEEIDLYTAGLNAARGYSAQEHW